MTGSGTFESYVSVGASCAATPDGRLSGQPTASDCSPQPYPQVCAHNYLSSSSHIMLMHGVNTGVLRSLYALQQLLFG